MPLSGGARLAERKRKERERWDGGEKMGQASWAFPLLGWAETTRGGATCAQVVGAE
jgi:hypothetical protein